MVCLLSVAVVFPASASDKEDAVSLVKAASSYYKANGLEKTINEISSQEGKFRKGSIYVFAYDTEGTMVAHPDTDLMGRNLLNVPDAKGKKFRKEIIETAKKEGLGWVDYVYMNKTSKKMEDKTTYFEKADDLVFCSGIYKPIGNQP
jgi:signal transduction histidine kinase